MKSKYILLLLGLVFLTSCGSKESQKIELLQEATEAFESADSKEEVESVVEKYGEKLSKFEDKLTLEESQALENSIPVSKALSRYKLVADSKCYEFDVY